MKILHWMRRAIIHVLPIFFFFLFFFTLINWIESALFEKNGIQRFSFIQVAFAAALIAKIVLVVDHLPMVHRFRKKPLVYSVLWKTFFYWIILFCVRLLIRFIPFFWDDTKHLGDDISYFLDHVEWNVFFSIQGYYLMLLFIFVVFQELISKIGVKKARELFFGK